MDGYVEYRNEENTGGYLVPEEFAEQFGHVFERLGYHRKASKPMTFIGRPMVFHDGNESYSVTFGPPLGWFGGPGSPYVVLEPRDDDPIIVEPSS